MDWMAVFLIGLVSGVCFTAIFMTWRDQERHTERPDGQQPKNKKQTEEYYKLDPEPGAGPHAPSAHQEPAAAPSKGDELLARLDAPAVVFGEAGGESAEDLLGGTGSPPVQEPPRAPFSKLKDNYKKGRCRYCGGDFANISQHENTCKFRKGERTRKPRATKIEMAKRRAITDRAGVTCGKEGLEVEIPCKFLLNGKCTCYEIRPECCKMHPVGGEMCRNAIRKMHTPEKQKELLEMLK